MVFCRGWNHNLPPGHTRLSDSVIEGELETLKEFSARHSLTGKNRLQLALL